MKKIHLQNCSVLLQLSLGFCINASIFSFKLSEGYVEKIPYIQKKAAAYDADSFLVSFIIFCHSYTRLILALEYHD